MMILSPKFPTAMNKYRLVLTLHLISRYGCKVIACSVMRLGLTLLNRYNVDRHATKRGLDERCVSEITNIQEN